MSEQCARVESDAASFVLGDVPAERRAVMVAHLDSCSACRREVATLAEALDSVSAVVSPMCPGEGFVERVLAAADRSVAVVPGECSRGLGAPVGPGGRWRARAGGGGRRVAVVTRRRRTLVGLTAVSVVSSVVAFAAGSAVFLALAALCGSLDVTYLALVVAVTHAKARGEMESAFAGGEIPTEPCWLDHSSELLLDPGEPDERPAASVVAVANADLARFVVAYFAGWALTPVVAAIALLRGDLAGIERSPLLARIVLLQQQGRSQSLRLLVAGATSVAVVGGGAATMLAAPGTASAATTTGPYTVRPGDTLSAIASRYGVSASYLAQLNGISDPNLIVPGEIINPAGPTPGAGPSPDQAARTYTVQPGDTLFSIARRYRTTIDQLAATNKISDPNLILPGQILHLGATPVQAADTPLPQPPPPPPAHPPPPPQDASGYVNPFRSGSWSPARTDEGVDWIPNAVSPVVAIGDGVITYSSMNSGWPAGGFITYRLTGGPYAGLHVYVAEHITDLLPVGTVVSAGQQIATALPGYPWTEWGWASASGPEPAASARYSGAPDGTATPGGKAFARFLMSLGVTGMEDPGPGPATP